MPILGMDIPKMGILCERTVNTGKAKMRSQPNFAKTTAECQGARFCAHLPRTMHAYI